MNGCSKTLPARWGSMLSRSGVVICFRAQTSPTRPRSAASTICGNPPALLNRLVDMAKYKELRQEQAELRKEGKLMGIGIAAFLDKSGTGPSRQLSTRGGLHGGFESATIRVHSDGKVTVLSGSHSHGQGHSITFAAIAADRLGVPVEDVAV